MYKLKKKSKNGVILKRILHGIKYLAEKNLVLRGHRESLQADSDSNVGNFLGLMKFLAFFDPVLREHLDLSKAIHIQPLTFLQVFKMNLFTSWHLIFAKT